ALVRFPPTATKEIQYLNAKGALTYTDIAGDPVLYGNLPPREISMKDVFRSGDSSKKFKIAEGQWYRYAPSYVSPAYHLLEGLDRFVIVSIFIPKLRLILILNSFLGSSDSLVFSELFHSLAPRPLAARSISDFLLTYLAT